ncbi:5' nucleotidase, NT5C type [Synoicihabitans lomoniglobus]|uniref:Uncharacterized protein n=1 Tax=Synoicihabitans lomoniglobus TaxID=2909285 RepID=A0AAE9ZX49_9BACT|nr:hypothetical protein [Opitutaceae bacterium LMO-M01]WED65096.1 hypothetical protein PXH66_22385 [Opitutaceae bacterium LMO-M01]
MKPILYIAMDDVLVDVASGLNFVAKEVVEKYAGRVAEIPGLFGKMDAVPEAVSAFRQLAERYDTYVVSTAPWDNPTAWSDKVSWVSCHLGDATRDRLVLTPTMSLLRGDILITATATDFTGEVITLGSAATPDWAAVLQRLIAD